MERHSINVSYRLNGMRLDHAISEGVPGMSRRRAKAIIDMGGAYLNKKRMRIASRAVRKGDQIDIEYNAKLFELKKAPIELRPEDILYSDDGIIVINKPAGLPAQATRDQAVIHVLPLLTKLLTAMGKPIPDLQLVHRLDKDTTGCLIIATNKNFMTYLTDQFREHKVEKTYHALTWGLSSRASFEESCLLSAIQPGTGKVKVVKTGGKPSKTFFRTLQSFETLKLSLLECRPITGRSHQIRVHLEKNDLPILGDKVYGEGKRHELPETIKVSHQLLHSQSISFSPAPALPKITVTAPYPQSFVDVLTALNA
jgi:23S rRNA pseudouridine1911/1915/1917 synthase